MLMPQSIERILSAGGGVSVDGASYMPQSLERFAAFAASSGATLIIRNAHRFMPQSLERIAAFGRGRVIFELN